MRSFNVPAGYEKLITAAIAIAVADAGRDQARRAEGRPGTVRDTLIDPLAIGRIVITVAPLPIPAEAEADPFVGVRDEAIAGKYIELLKVS